MISRFLLDTNENCDFLSFYVAIRGSTLPGPIGCPEASIRNCHCALRNTKISQFCPFQCVVHFKNVILFGGTLVNGILFALLDEVQAVLLPIAYTFTCCHLKNKHKGYTTLMSTGDTL